MVPGVPRLFREIEDVRYSVITEAAQTAKLLARELGVPIRVVEVKRTVSQRIQGWDFSQRG